MNLANKITMSRIVMSVLIIIMLLFPFDATGVTIPKLFINESIVVDIKYLISGVLFIVAALTDFIDGYIARRCNMVTDFGKMLDAIADKVLVNVILVILASTGFISAIIPVIIIARDTIVDSIKMVAGSKGRVIGAIATGKIKTACMMVGITLTLFYNLPFELMNIRISDALLIIATILSVVSAVQYFYMNKDLIFSNDTDIEELDVK